jgi:hypothetical protein
MDLTARVSSREGWRVMAWLGVLLLLAFSAGCFWGFWKLHARERRVRRMANFLRGERWRR